MSGSVYGKIIAVLVVIAIGGLIAWAIVGSKRSAALREKAEAEKKKAQAERWAMTDRALSQMAQRFNAITNWHEPFKRDISQPVYSLELHKLMVITDRRPILLTGCLTDIYSNPGQYWVRIATAPRRLDVEIYFELKATPEQVGKLLPRTERCDDFAPTLAAVARIDNVRKAKLRARARAESEDSAYIEIEPGSFFIAEGSLLDFFVVLDGSLEPGSGGAPDPPLGEKRRGRETPP